VIRMAKKQEFRPDSTQKSLLQRLHLTKQQRKSVLKWVLYALFLILLSLLQDVILTHLRIYNATTDLVPCTIFIICVIEGTQSGSIFSLVASLLYHFSVNDLGVYAVLFITFLAIIVTAFRQGYLRKGFSAAMLCTCVAMFLYEMAVFGIGIFLGHTYPGRFVGFCITAGLSMLAAPLLYPLVQLIASIGGDTWKE